MCASGTGTEAYLQSFHFPKNLTIPVILPLLRIKKSLFKSSYRSRRAEIKQKLLNIKIS